MFSRKYFGIVWSGFAKCRPAIPVESRYRSTHSQSLNKSAAAHRHDTSTFRVVVFAHDASPESFLARMNKSCFAWMVLGRARHAGVNLNELGLLRERRTRNFALNQRKF